MRESPPLSPELEAFLAPHRALWLCEPFVETRAIARARALDGAPGTARLAWSLQRTLALAIGVVAALGAVASASGVWRSVVRETRPASPMAAMEPAALVAPAIPEARADEPEIEAAPLEAPRVRTSPRRTTGKVATATVHAPTDAELQLLRAMRQALTQGEFATVLDLTDAHLRRFRNGALVEEREALRVESLAGLGRLEDARDAAAEFHSRFPQSVLLSTFDRIRAPGP